MTDKQPTQESPKNSALAKSVIVLLLIAGAAMAFYAKVHVRKSTVTEKGTVAEVSVTSSNESPKETISEESTTDNAAEAKPLPRLIELGSVRCIPCRMMAPILENVKKKYGESIKIEFIDVWENPAEAEKYQVRAIPTQVFVDSSGKEVFRHTGFFPEEELVGKLKSLRFIPQ